MSDASCIVDACGRRAKYRSGLCALHYTRLRKSGTLAAPERATSLDRLNAKVKRTASCWLWTAAVGNHGYGVIGMGRRTVLAHRLSYELHVGPIPEGLTLDHLCRTPLCVNPAHLEPVTNKENILRSEGPTARNARKTHCNQGHELTPGNLYRDSRGGRICRTCHLKKCKDRRQATR